MSDLPEVSIDGRALDDDAVRVLRQLITRERRWLRERTAVVEKLYRIFNDDEDRDASIEWVREQERRLAAVGTPK